MVYYLDAIFILLSCYVALKDVMYVANGNKLLPPHGPARFWLTPKTEIKQIIILKEK